MDSNSEVMYGLSELSEDEAVEAFKQQFPIIFAKYAKTLNPIARMAVQSVMTNPDEAMIREIVNTIYNSAFFAEFDDGNGGLENRQVVGYRLAMAVRV